MLGQSELARRRLATNRMRTFLTAMWLVIAAAVAVRLSTGSERWATLALVISALAVGGLARARTRQSRWS